MIVMPFEYNDLSSTNAKNRITETGKYISNLTNTQSALPAGIAVAVINQPEEG